MVNMDYPPKKNNEGDKTLKGGAKKNWKPYKSQTEKEIDQKKQPAQHFEDFEDFKVGEEKKNQEEMDKDFEKKLENFENSDEATKNPKEREMDEDFGSLGLDKGNNLSPEESIILNELLEDLDLEKGIRETFTEDVEEKDNESNVVGYELPPTFMNENKTSESENETHEDKNETHEEIPIENIDNLLKALDEREKNKIESAGRFKKALVGTQKWWDEKLEWKIDPKTGEKKPNKLGKTMKVAMGAAFLGTATIGGAWLMGVPPSNLNIASRLGMRIVLATGINMAVVHGLFEKVGKKISGFFSKFKNKNNEENIETNQKEKAKGKMGKYLNLQNSFMVGGVGLSFLLSSGGLVLGIVAGGIAIRKTSEYIIRKKLEKTEKELSDLKKLFLEETKYDGYTPADLYHNVDGIGDNYDKMTEQLAKRIKRLKRAKTIINSATTIGTGIATISILSAEVEHDKEIMANASKDAHQEQQEVEDAVKTIDAKGKAMEDAIENLRLKLESTSVEFEHGEGAIKTIEGLKEKILENYGGDVSKAPLSIQEIYNSNPTEEAIKLGFFNPSDPSGAESASIPEGSTLSFDKNGNLVFHNVENGADQTLINGNGEIVNKYDGKFIDSDDSAGLREQRRIFEENLEKHGDSIDKIDNIENKDLFKNANDFEKATYGEENEENTPETTEQQNSNIEESNEENMYSLDENQQKELESLHKNNLNLLTKNGELEGVKYAMEAGDARGILDTPIEDLNEKVHDLARYVSLLHEQTGIEPSNGESIQDYIQRTEIIAERKGILDDISNQMNNSIGESAIENTETNPSVENETENEENTLENNIAENPYNLTGKELEEVEKINIKLFGKLGLTNIYTIGTTETNNEFPAHLLLKIETGNDETNAIPNFVKGVASMTNEFPFEPTPLNPIGETVPEYIKRISQLVYSKGMILRASEYGTPLLSGR